MDIRRRGAVMSRGIDEYLRAIIKGIPIILLAVVIGVLTGYVVCEIVLGPKFEAETSVTFYPAESGSGNPMVLQLTGADKEEEKARREECARIIGGEETAAAVIDKIGLKVDGQPMPASRLMGMLRVPVPENTDNIVIYVTDTDEKRTAAIAGAVAEMGALKIEEAFPGSQARDMSFSGIETREIGPDLKIFMAAGGLIGLISAVLLILLIFISDDTIRTARDVDRALGVETIGVIPFDKSEVQAVLSAGTSPSKMPPKKPGKKDKKRSARK